jgi:hypothetical protein
MSEPASWLPPQPDSSSGYPRPPAAPLLPDMRSGELPKSATVAFRPPPGQGLVLEWFQESRRSVVVSVALVLGLCLLVATFRAEGFGWMTTWWLWLMIVALLALVYAMMRGKRVSAGAEWVRDGSAWVRTYELTEIKASRATATYALTLTDSDGRHLYTKVVDLQLNPALWDLVYNGFLHSVHVNGATTNSLAREALHLDS